MTKCVGGAACKQTLFRNPVASGAWAVRVWHGLPLCGSLFLPVDFVTCPQLTPCCQRNVRQLLQRLMWMLPVICLLPCSAMPPCHDNYYRCYATVTASSCSLHCRPAIILTRQLRPQPHE